MESPRTFRRYATADRPVSPRDYDVPVGWWGWSWDPPVPMSVTQLIAAGNMDARTTALCGMAVASHGSILIAAEQPHSGKTTTLTALLDFLPMRVRRVFVRGWAETFDYLLHGSPSETLLLVNELSSHLPVYLWGPKAVRVFRTLRDGYALASTLHADSAEEAMAQLVGELGVDPSDLARVHLLLVMRLYGATRGGYERRVVSASRVVRRGRTVAALPLVVRDEVGETWSHDEPAQLDLLAALRGEERGALARELEGRTEHLTRLVSRGCREIREVRAALASYRPAALAQHGRGDPVV